MVEARDASGEHVPAGGDTVRAFLVGLRRARLGLLPYFDGERNIDGCSGLLASRDADKVSGGLSGLSKTRTTRLAYENCLVYKVRNPAFGMVE